MQSDWDANAKMFFKAYWWLCIYEWSDSKKLSKMLVIHCATQIKHQHLVHPSAMTTYFLCIQCTSSPGGQRMSSRELKISGSIWSSGWWQIAMIYLATPWWETRMKQGFLPEITLFLRAFLVLKDTNNTQHTLETNTWVSGTCMCLENS